MKKLVLTESQIKSLVDKLVLKEQDVTNTQTEQNNSEYSAYYVGSTLYAVKNDGSNRLFRLKNDGQGGKKYQLAEELATDITFTMLSNGWPDVLQNLHDTGGNSNDESSIGSNYISKTDNGLMNGVQQYDPNTGSPLYNRDGSPKMKYEPIEFQRIMDEKTENSLELALYNSGNVMQTAKIPGSVTDGIRVITLGMSQGEKNVPVLGTLFFMITSELPSNLNLKVVSYKEGNKIILNKTAVRTKDRYYMWLRFIGQMFGTGGYPWSPNEEEQPTQPETPPTTQPSQIVLTFEKGLNDAFNFNDITLNESGVKNLQELINYAKQNYQNVTAEIPVICSSSIDGDPKQIIKGNITRFDYNMDLSKRRANAIANQLSTQIGIPTLKFIPQGIGETDKFDPGKKWPEVKDNTQTAGNRKLIIQLPKLQKTVQQNVK